jgi:hypothetical protein
MARGRGLRSQRELEEDDHDPQQPAHHWIIGCPDLKARPGVRGAPRPATIAAWLQHT